MARAWHCMIHNAGLWEPPDRVEEDKVIWNTYLVAMAIDWYNMNCGETKRILPVNQESWDSVEHDAIYKISQDVATEVYSNKVCDTQWATDKASYQFLDTDLNFPGWNKSSSEPEERVFLYSEAVQKFLWEMRVMGKVGPDGNLIQPAVLVHRCNLCGERVL